MSVVTSAVIVVSYASKQVTSLLTEPGDWGRVESYQQAFAEIDSSGCGGGKVIQSDIYAAGFNHIDASALSKWFLLLPWHRVDKAVLIYDTEGDGRTIVRSPGWDAEDEY